MWDSLCIALSTPCPQSSDKPEQLNLEKNEPSFLELGAWVGAAAAFGVGIWYFMGREKAEEYFAGYLLEQSLSVDNLFVFLLVFGYFKTPAAAQGKVLKYGIISAAVLRAIFILGGVELIKLFEPALGLFAAILIVSSIKLLTSGDEDDSDGDLSDNAVVQLCRRFIKTADEYDGDNFFTVLKDGSKVCCLSLMARPHLLRHAAQVQRLYAHELYTARNAHMAAASHNGASHSFLQAKDLLQLTRHRWHCHGETFTPAIPSITACRGAARLFCSDTNIRLMTLLAARLRLRMPVQKECLSLLIPTYPWLDQTLEEQVVDPLGIRSMLA